MHPVLIRLASFRLPTYGVLLALALILALYTVVRLGRREGLDAGRLLDFSTWLILVALVGAKVLMILTDWSFYRNNPSEIFSWATLQAGGVFYGGFLAAVFFAVWYIRVYRLPLWKVFDVYAPAIALGQSVGRLGCFAAGCDYGRRTTSFLGVVFTSPDSHNWTDVPLGVRLHPTQLYESLATLALFGILLWRYRKKSRDGEIFLLYLALYAAARFFLEFLRGDEDRGFVFHHLLSTSQFIAILALVAAAGLALHFWGSLRKAPQAATALPAGRRAGGHAATGGRQLGGKGTEREA
jgi:phosphatidylglycerol:prolipoprotein diacylglycerol transferase